MIPDKLLINLKIISKIQKNGRITRSYDGIISLENEIFYQSIKRFFSNDSRRQATFEISSVVNEAIDMLRHILNSKYISLKFAVCLVAKNISFDAFIDPTNNFALNDKFSQLNTLCQLENLQNFYFLNDLLARKKICVYAMWLDIYTGDVYIFSYKEKTFVKLTEESYASISESLKY